MSDETLEYFARESAFDLLSEVIRRIEVRVDRAFFRIEVLKDFGISANPYRTRCRISRDKSNWAEYPLAHASATTADEALNSALQFLAEDARQSTSG